MLGLHGRRARRKASGQESHSVGQESSTAQHGAYGGSAISRIREKRHHRHARAHEANNDNTSATQPPSHVQPSPLYYEQQCQQYQQHQHQYQQPPQQQYQMSPHVMSPEDRGVPAPAGYSQPPPYACVTPYYAAPLPPLMPSVTYPINTSDAPRRRQTGVAMVANSLQAATQSLTGLNIQDAWNLTSSQALNQGSALFDIAKTTLNDVVNAVDADTFHEDAKDRGSHPFSGPEPRSSGASTPRGGLTGMFGSTVMNQFQKVWAYSNSRLPPHLPPCKLYISTYPLICLAAQYSISVYNKPVGKEKEDHVGASVMQGTKAMTLKSLPIDDMNTVVFAIRGTSSFVDWAINFRPAPTAPKDFLDDEGNLCHAGFLQVAKSMIPSVTARLKELLQENPGRSTASLLITGHSAGGAVAQLLYAHMLSEALESELAYLTGFFKRVHCITFGAPPVSLLPLTTPNAKRHHNSVFLAFANEGDPVIRADKAVLMGLIKLIASPAPSASSAVPTSAAEKFETAKPSFSRAATAPAVPTRPPAQTYPIPPSVLACGGRLILLRQKYAAQDANDVEACQITNDDLQTVVFGDPSAHTMDMYAKRVELLATRAITAGGIAG